MRPKARKCAKVRSPSCPACPFLHLLSFPLRSKCALNRFNLRKCAQVRSPSCPPFPPLPLLPPFLRPKCGLIFENAPKCAPNPVPLSCKPRLALFALLKMFAPRYNRSDLFYRKGLREFLAACGVRGTSCDTVAQDTVSHEVVGEGPRRIIFDLETRCPRGPSSRPRRLSGGATSQPASRRCRNVGKVEMINLFANFSLTSNMIRSHPTIIVPASIQRSSITVPVYDPNRKYHASAQVSTIITESTYFSNTCTKYAHPGYEFTMFLAHVCKVHASWMQI